MRVRHKLYFCFWICTGLVIQGCVGTRHLQKNEYLLAKQTIKGNKKVQKDELIPYYQQKTNRKLLGISIWLWLHELGKKHYNPQKIEEKIQEIKEQYDSKIAAFALHPHKVQNLEKRKKEKLANQEKKLKEGNWLMRIGEAPVVYSPEQQAATEENLKNYLQSKGYFEAKVSSNTTISDQRAYVNYRIQENAPHLVQAFKLISPDTSIYQLLQPYEQQSLIQQGKNYDQEILRQERERIYNILVNEGYWDFNKQYISFQVDTTAHNKNVTIETIIALPAHESVHQVYHIDSIVFELKPPFISSSSDMISHEGIFFKDIQQHFDPLVISNKIPLQTGQLYKKDDIINTQKRLSRLDIFNYVHINSCKTSKGHLTTYIHTSLADKFQFSNEVGIQMTKLSPNPFYELSLKTRNLFKHLETLTFSTKVSIEGAFNTAETRKFYGNKNFNIAVDLSLPQFLLPLRSKTQGWLDKYKPVTSFKLGYDFDRRSLGYTEKEPDYTKHTIKTLFIYRWKANEHVGFELSPLSVDLINSRLSPQFNEELQHRKHKGDLSYRAYNPSLISNLYLKTTLEKIPPTHNKDPYTSLELLFESGGTLQNLIDFKEIFGNKLTYYRYLKLNTNFVQHIQLQPSTKLAYQFNIGVAYPYDRYKILPHDKSYFAGGPSSNRAWPPRTLGPGSYHPTMEKDTQLKFRERPGEFILQGNVELRQKLAGILEGALFVDAGNVWMLTNQSQPAKNFSFARFYREIAVGIGVGTRFDFNFFILRLDIGFKLYDPGKPIGQRLFPSNMFKDFTVNIGLGYPF